MTSCVAVSESAVVVSNIDNDKCFVYLLADGSIRDLTERLGNAYQNMPINIRDLEKACAAFSVDGKLFAYNPNKGKLLSVWNTSDWSLVENKTLAKHATKIVFNPKSNVIIVGDKKGDVHAFEELPIRILGHSSMILDICFSENGKFIVTSDSDEKVRVSHYPNGKNIIHYLMGHRAYVSGVCMLNNFILSGSGDCTLSLWDFNNGELCDTLNLINPIQSVVAVEDVAAIHSYNSTEVHFIKTLNMENGWHIKKLKTIQFDRNVLDLAAYGNQLWIITRNSIHKYIVYSSNEFILKNVDDEIAQVRATLGQKLKTFVCLENTNLMNFLYKKMIDKQVRVELSQSCEIKNVSKRIKIS